MRKIPCPYTDSEPLFRHGGAVSGGPSVLDFSASINPLPEIRNWLCGCLGEFLDHRIDRSESPLGSSARWALCRYPEPHSATLAARIGRHHGLEAAHVVVGNGSSELIDLLPRALATKRAAIAEPTYTEYLRACRRAGVEVSHWLAEGADFRPEPFDPADADLVWMCNPNNPTSQLWERPSLLKWIDDHPRTVFVVDEAFLPFRADEQKQSLVPELSRLSNLVVLRSLTKLYAIPGLRLGYALACPELAQRIRGLQVPWSVNGLAQAVGLRIVADRRFLAMTQQWLARELPQFVSRLRACSARIEPLPAHANFVLLRLADVDSGWLTRRLAQRGIRVRDASNFVGLDQRYVRVALGLPEQNQRLCDELRALCADVLPISPAGEGHR
jgi:threonine-phosphate decarboxylase